MALIVGGTTVTGTQTLEASTLTGTASAINGSNITNLPSTDPTTAQVIAATAGASVGAVGTYAACSNETGNGTNPGSTTAGSNLRYTNHNNQRGSAPSGTWRAMGYSLTSGTVSATGTTWLRIS